MARLRPLLETGHNKQRRFVTTRVPQTERKMEFQGIGGVEQKEERVRQKAVV